MNRLLWKTKNKYDFNKEEDFLERILTQAGVDDIYEFLNVNKSHTHSPFLLRNMEEGIDLLHSKLGGHIFIKIDPDVDGYTSAAYIRGFIEDISPNTIISYGTKNQKEHGIWLDDIENNVKNPNTLDLIIVPDAGSKSVKECKEITEKYNIPILIIDHHEIDDEVMRYATLINCTDGQYPNNTLSGVGVVHKFCLAYAQKYGIKEEVCNYYLDLVSLGLIADAMDMRNLETRYYALEGLKDENRHNLFIKELAEKYAEEMKFGFTLDSIGWVIAPKINGVTRYGTPEEQIDTYRALCGEKEDREYQPRIPKGAGKNSPKPPVEIHSLQKTMARICDNAKGRQDTAVRNYMKALDELIQKLELFKNSVLIIDASEIVDKKTVTGLVANKLTDKYHRPIVILKSKDESEFGGSGRGYDKGVIDDFNSFLNETGLIECSGHPNAFGVVLKKNNLASLTEACNKKLKLDDLVTIHEVDYEVKADALTNKSVMKVAESYKIWGKGVPEPTFVITNIKIPAKDIIAYGENKNFIKFKYNGIDFVKKYCCKDEWETMTLRDRYILGENHKILDMVVIGTFVLNEWDGTVYPQVKIKYFESVEHIASTIPNKTNDYEIDDDFLF